MKHLAQWIAIIMTTAALSATAAQAAVMTIRGPVVAVDHQRATIEIRDAVQGQTLLVQLPQDQPSLIIKRNGQQVALQDVQVGQVLEIRHEEQNGRQVVQQIEILPAAAPTTQVEASSTTTQVTTQPSVTAATSPETTTQVQTTPAPAVQVNTPIAAPIVPPPAPEVAVHIDLDDEWGPGDKLLRGVGNVLFGFIEIPRNIFNTSRDENILAGLTVGTFKGVGYTVVRMGTGAYEIVTFPLPLPEGYRPLMEPEYPWEDAEPTPGYLG